MTGVVMEVIKDRENVETIFGASRRKLALRSPLETDYRHQQIADNPILFRSRLVPAQFWR